MKFLVVVIFLLSATHESVAQSDSLEYPRAQLANGGYLLNIFNPFTKTYNQSFNYSNKWDIDGDKKNDSVYFIGNGGAHSYFYLRIILSSDGEQRNFPFIQFDMPYYQSFDSLYKYGKNAAIQFVVYDFDADGVNELYLNFDNDFGYIPKKWRKKGINAKYIIMNFVETKTILRNY